MKKHLLALSAAAVLLAPNAVGAEGFSINEWSAEGFAMGGARMFAENDAANMAYNPASLTKIKGEVAKILGVSQVQVSRLETKIIEKLKKKTKQS